MVAGEPLFDRAADEDDGMLLAEMAGGRSQDHGVAGVDDTVTALAEARVDVLVAHDDPDDDRRAYFGPLPSQIARRASTLRDQGVAKPVEARLIDVAVRAALGTGAGVRIVGDDVDLAGGIGGLLRWAS